MHVWQTFLSLAHVWQTSVFLKRMPLPGHQRNTVNGRVQIFQPGTRAGIFVSIPRRVFRARRNQVLHARTLHSWPYGSFVCVSPQQRVRTFKLVSASSHARPLARRSRASSSFRQLTYHAHVRVVAQARLAQDRKVLRSHCRFPHHARALVNCPSARARTRESKRAIESAFTYRRLPSLPVDVRLRRHSSKSKTHARARSFTRRQRSRARKGGESGREGFPLGKKRRRRSGNRAAISRRAGHSRKDLK